MEDTWWHSSTMTIPYPFTKAWLRHFKTRLHKGYINNTMQRVRGRIKTPDRRKSLLPASLLGNLLFCKIYVKKFRQMFMPLHKQCLGVYQNKCICLSSGNQSCGCNSLSKGCRCRQHTVGNGMRALIASNCSSRSFPLNVTPIGLPWLYYQLFHNQFWRNTACW